MGMSASQARFLSITARMHDLEYQAQTIQNAKLALGNDTNAAYEEYCKGVDATQYQLKVITGGEITKVDLTYNAMVASGYEPEHPMYILTDAATDKIYLPEAIVSGMNNKIPETLNDFLKVVATKYVYPGQGMGEDEAVTKLSSEGYANYWTAVYYQLTGYISNDGNIGNGHGFIAISNQNASDRQWIQKNVEKGELIINAMQSTKDNVADKKINIFAQTNMAVDTNLSIATDELTVSRAAADYEQKVENIHQKDKQLDLRLTRIENEHNALKTEYETVKDLVKKNIERSYKTFNA
ncbi:MAG: hypothetical protein ACI4S3_07175 [Candidatus Gastranaerophilaceae bacterium]